MNVGDLALFCGPKTIDYYEGRDSNTGNVLAVVRLRSKTADRWFGHVVEVRDSASGLSVGQDVSMTEKQLKAVQP